MVTIAVSKVETPFGQFLIAAAGDRVFATRGPRAEAIEPRDWAMWLWPEDVVTLAGRAHRDVHEQVREYFRGQRRAFDLQLALEGNELHVRAWLAAAEIPYGRTETYGDLSWEIGAPGAARAVGRAMALCPTPLFIPCHRVVGAGGKRCGDLEAWERRKQLLDFERHNDGSRKPRRNRLKAFSLLNRQPEAFSSR